MTKSQKLQAVGKCTSFFIIYLIVRLEWELSVSKFTGGNLPLKHDLVKQNLQDADASMKHLGKCISYFPRLNKLLINDRMELQFCIEMVLDHF